MRKIVFVLLLLTIGVRPCFAQDKPSGDYYQELLEKYRIYQTQISPYTIAKSRQKTYQSIASRAEYLQAAKKMLSAEIEAIYVYANFVRRRLVEATSILNYQESLYYVKLDDEITAVNLMKNKAAEISSLSDLAVFWKELDNRYLNIIRFGYLTKSYIELGSFAKINDNLKITKDKIGRQISEVTFFPANVKAAKDRFSVLEKNYNEIVTTFNQAAKIHKDAPQSSDFKAGAVQIRNLLNQSISQTDKLTFEYRDIVLSLNQK